MKYDKKITHRLIWNKRYAVKSEKSQIFGRKTQKVILGEKTQIWGIQRLSGFISRLSPLFTTFKPLSFAA